MSFRSDALKAALPHAGAAIGELRSALDELVSTHRQVVQQERLRAFREMAGEVAHDFNNTLSGILARAQLLLADVQDPDVRRSLRMIEQVALEGAWVVRRFQDFSRTRPSRPFQPLQLDQLVEEIAASARSRWTQQLAARGITGEVRCETGMTPSVSGDVAEVRQVLTSIALNALDAMPEGGNLTFLTGYEGDRAFCRIADTGRGMSEEIRPRIFDPFFTTKREKGKGFGLSGAYAIVDRHGGEITVESEIGKGTVFTVWFPVASTADVSAPSPARVAAPSVAPAPKPAPGAKILVVDDSEEVREVLRELLSRHGHTVVTVPDGESGLVELDSRRFDLAMLDLGLPGISGLEVAHRLKERWPGTRVALMTGYGDRMGSGDGEPHGVDFVLAKPFSLDQLRSVVDHAFAVGHGGPVPS
ncbi:MAG TPA: ATP-binding protein [Candidatus Polarisedimenticolia bacterium]|jgi:nitrogen-specific signal transduction histidine kinase/CheY-like chemotaxis protein|nr:ATP-binding protein [Candidatus Polarisedimenticolia bacterium]